VRIATTATIEDRPGPSAPGLPARPARARSLCRCPM